MRQSLTIAALVMVASTTFGCSTLLPSYTTSSSARLNHRAYHPPAGGDPEEAASGCSPDVAAKPGTSHEETISVQGQPRTFIVSVPASYMSNQPSPVVLAFHGSGQSDSRMQAITQMSTLPAVAAYPEGASGSNGPSWQGAPYSSGADDVQFTADLITDLENKYCVDATRIFATGISNGGGFTSLLACRLADRIAAFASISGAYYPQTQSACEGSPPVPMLEFHGTADPVIHYDGGESHGQSYMSSQEFIKRWVEKDGCAGEERRSHPASGIELQIWQPCDSGTSVEHYRIDGGGHTWPGSPEHSGPGRATPELPATQIIWDFFLQHPLTART